MDMCTLHCFVACGLIMGCVVPMGFPWLFGAFAMVVCGFEWFVGLNGLWDGAY